MRATCPSTRRRPAPELDRTAAQRRLNIADCVSACQAVSAVGARPPVLGALTGVLRVGRMCNRLRTLAEPSQCEEASA